MASAPWFTGSGLEAPPRSARIDAWRKKLTPTHDLRQWFGHDPAERPEFRQGYRQDLREAGQQERLKQLATVGKRKTIPLVLSELLDRFA